MDENRKHMAESLLNLTLDIIYLLTGEDYIVVKTISDEDGWSRTQIPITKPPPHSLMNERSNEQKIIELTNKIMELLTGETPIRCQDVAVYFSMEEWEYIEEHKDQYKDVMMENRQSPTSLYGSSLKNIPDWFSDPLLTQICQEDNHNAIEDYKVEEELADNKYEVITEEEKEMLVEDSPPCKEEETPTCSSTDDFAKNLERHLLSPDYKVEDNKIAQDNSGEHFITTTLTSVLHNSDFSTDPTNHKEPSSDQSLNDQQDPGPGGGKIFTCAECGKNFKTKCSLCRHNRIHKNERPFLCSECGKCFIQKSHLVQHQKNHRGEKPFLCTECGKCFTQKSSLCGHQRIHTGEKPFSCSVCRKCFNQKSDLVRHQRIHTGEKPYSCSECGKCFTLKSHLVDHQKNHTGDKPFSCPDCGKCFIQKAYLVKHQIIHTRENLFSCSECGKCFTLKSAFITHKKQHTNPKPC
ncbi:gastrula zinc finger protein XlCGF66.1-like isoform X2 [Rhinoderma darwinii]|uniref:gastrula zinc finger protein XlCGF66.1-like isoform X2 n=1 Tax=Rhinoderma darwinii TaxID=43563 RepID=UPI003F6683FB